MKKIVICALLVCVGILFILFLQYRERTSMSPINVGFVSLDADQSNDRGRVIKRAVELEVEDVNSTGGIHGRPINVIFETNLCGLGQSDQVFKKLITEDNVVFIIGELCPLETTESVSRSTEYKVPLFLYCHEEFDPGFVSEYVFKEYPHDVSQAVFAATFLYQKKPKLSVAVLYEDTKRGNVMKRAFSQAYARLGGVLVSEVRVSSSTLDYSRELSAIKLDDVEYLYTILPTTSAQHFVREYESLQLPVIVLGINDWKDISPSKKTTESTHRMYYVDRTVHARYDFKSRLLKEVGGSEVPECAAEAYDAVTAFTNAATEGGMDDPQALAHALRKVNFDGVSGLVAFDKQGNLKTPRYEVFKLGETLRSR